MTQEKLEQPSMYCRQCGYALVGLSEDRCPECARPFDLADPRTFSRYPQGYLRRRWIKRIALTLATVALMGAFLVAASSAWIYWQYHADWQAEQQAIAALRAISPGTWPVYHKPAWQDAGPLHHLIVPLDCLRDRVDSIGVLARPSAEADLAHLAAFKQCTNIVLTNTRIRDDQMRHLEGLTRLTVLQLGQNPGVTDGGLAHLKGLRSIMVLSLSGTSISADGLRHLRGMSRLWALSLTGTQVRGEGLAELQALPSLNTLELEGTPITDADLVHLKPLPVTWLFLDRTGITDAGLAEVGQMVSLQRLHISATTITDAGLRHLSGLSRLRWLRLDNTAVTDAGLKHLEGLSNLRDLSVRGTKVTQEGIQQLKQTMPSLNIVGP